MNLTPKMKAAVSAVYAYIRSEEDALSLEAGVPEISTQAMAPLAIQKHWGLSGRLDMMQWRGLMQMRTFRGRGIR
jgi:hypothetical protein